MGIGVIGVPSGSPIELQDLRLESVVEECWSQDAAVPLRGECVRCLVVIFGPLEIDVQELFVYREARRSEDEAQPAWRVT